METQTLLSWNVNGLRSVQKKGFLEWLNLHRPDVLAVQETRALPEQLSSELRNPDGYYVQWHSAQRKGYSGVAVFSRREPVSVVTGWGNTAYDQEGRVLGCEFETFWLFNVYFPNGKKDDQRLKYKLTFYRDFFRFIEQIKKQGKTLLICGDYNTAHTEIDLARPKENSGVSGFLPEERALLDELVGLGYVDTLRHFRREPGLYSWWDMKTSARSRNIGWRIDYFFIDRPSVQRLVSAFIQADVYGSDHCPVGITLRG